MDKIFKTHFDQRKIEPSDNAWIQIESTLSKESDSKKNFKLITFGKIAIFILCIISICILLINNIVQESASKIIVENTAPKNDHQNPKILEPLKTTPNTSALNTPMATKVVPKKAVAQKSTTPSVLPISKIDVASINNQASVILLTADIDTHLEEHSKNQLSGLLTGTERPFANSDKAIAIKSMVKTHNKYLIDPEKLLMEAEKDAEKRHFIKTLKTIKEFSTHMITAVMSRNEIEG